MRLTPEQRHLMIDNVRKGINVSEVARIFNVTRKTVYLWWNRTKKARNYLFGNKKREYKKRKLTDKIISYIVALRTSFKWGTARIQQALIKLPKFMRDVFEVIVQKVRLSRQTINNVLKEFGINGYERKFKVWKFFRAKYSDELWQLDIKGPFKVEGKKYWIILCIDDYSRYIILTSIFNRALKTNDIVDLLKNTIQKTKIKPKSILTDNGPQFWDEWEIWCNERNIQPLFAHPYYPQDKGKIERSIRNLTEEFVNLLTSFPEWINHLNEYVRWYNKDRFHWGIHDYPKDIYFK